MTRPALTPWGRLGGLGIELRMWCARFDDWNERWAPPYREPPSFTNEHCFRRAAEVLAAHARYIDATPDRDERDREIAARLARNPDVEAHPFVAELGITLAHAVRAEVCSLELKDIRALIYAIAVWYEDERQPLPSEVMTCLFYALGLTPFDRPSGGLTKTQVPELLGISRTRTFDDFVASARWVAENPDAKDYRIRQQFKRPGRSPADPARPLDAKTLKQWKADPHWQRLRDQHASRGNPEIAASWKAAWERVKKE